LIDFNLGICKTPTTCHFSLHYSKFQQLKSLWCYSTIHTFDHIWGITKWTRVFKDWTHPTPKLDPQLMCIVQLELNNVSGSDHLMLMNIKASSRPHCPWTCQMNHILQYNDTQWHIDLQLWQPLQKLDTWFVEHETCSRGVKKMWISFLKKSKKAWAYMQQNWWTESKVRVKGSWYQSW
jgi:hypothetical protein